MNTYPTDCQALIFAYDDELVFVARSGDPLTELDRPDAVFDLFNVRPPTPGLWAWRGRCFVTVPTYGSGDFQIEASWELRRLTSAETTQFETTGQPPWIFPRGVFPEVTLGQLADVVNRAAAGEVSKPV